MFFLPHLCNVIVFFEIVLAPFWATMTNTQMCPGTFLGPNDIQRTSCISNACHSLSGVAERLQHTKNQMHL